MSKLTEDKDLLLSVYNLVCTFTTGTMLRNTDKALPFTEKLVLLIASRVIEECARVAYFSSEEAARFIRTEVPKRLGIGG